jgi:LPXTG-motif cell wall-anchored protein
MQVSSSRSSSADIFDRARAVAVAALVAAAATAILGSFLDWVTITERPRLAPGTDFGGQQVEAPEFSEPYTGVEARDGWIVVGAGVVLLASALGLAVRRRKVYAILAFLAATVAGGIAFADYRGIGDISSSISDRMEIVGDPEPAIGITLVAVAAIVGLAGAITALVATPGSR